MNYPKVIKSRDLELFRKEIKLLGWGGLQKLSRRRMIVVLPDQSPMAYRRTSKKWILQGKMRDLYPELFLWLNTHNHTVWVSSVNPEPLTTISVRIKI